MTGSREWLPIWREKGAHGETVAQLSGRSNYGAAEAETLANDAAWWLKLEPADSLLDIGCAAGLVGECLIPRVRRYVGLDYSEGAVARFRERLPGVDARVADALELPFEDGEFDVSLMGSVLLCLSLDECAQALREMRRVTKRRGYVSGNLEGLQPSGAECPANCRCYAHCTWFTRESLTQLAVSCGWAAAIATDMSDGLQHRGIMFDMLVIR